MKLARDINIHILGLSYIALCQIRHNIVIQTRHPHLPRLFRGRREMEKSPGGFRGEVKMKKKQGPSLSARPLPCPGLKPKHLPLETSYADVVAARIVSVTSWPMVAASSTHSCSILTCLMVSPIGHTSVRSSDESSPKA